MSDHSARLQDHFSNPRNCGALAHANAVGLFGAMRFGDALKLMLKIDPDTDVITQARFQTFGCSCAIASSSAITEMVIGKTTAEALDITAADIAEFLGGPPPERMYCPVMGYEALQLAIARYRGAADYGDGVEAALCSCFGVGGDLIERTIRTNKLTTPEQVTFYTKAGGQCVRCFKEIEGALARVNAEMAKEGLISATQAYRVGTASSPVIEVKPNGDAAPKAPPIRVNAARPALKPRAPRPPLVAAAGRKVGGSEQITLIQHAIEDLRPQLQRDGGDCELVDVDGNTVFVKLSGACVDCQLASVTLSGVQARLADKLGLPLHVVPVQ